MGRKKRIHKAESKCVERSGNQFPKEKPSLLLWLSINTHIGYFMYGEVERERNIPFAVLFSRVTLFGRVEEIKRNKYINGRNDKRFGVPSSYIYTPCQQTSI